MTRMKVLSGAIVEQALAVIKADNEDEEPASSKNSLCKGRLGFIL